MKLYIICGFGDVMKKKSIAVLIPCYNEEKTIVKVIKDFKKELPDAKIYVYDNNSTDKSNKLAKDNGAIVIKEIRQGKGNVVRSMFRDIKADCYLMVDADDTYPSKDAKKMCNLVLRDNYDMVVGDRLSSTYFTENKRPFHNFGNRIVRFLINKLFKANIKDVMSGYRAFSYNFVKSYPVLSKKFEIETEMTIHAIDKNFRVTSIPVQYKDRPKGSVSKLNTYKDGIMVIKTISELVKEYKPRLFFTFVSFIFFVVSFLLGLPVFIEYFDTGLVPRFPSLIVSMIFLVIALLLYVTGIILEVLSKKYNQLYELYLNSIGCGNDE